MLTVEDIQKIVDPHKPTFTQCWRDAFNTYNTKYIETRIDHSPLARALLLRDHCVANAIRSFANTPYSDCRKVSGLFCVQLSGEPVGVDGYIAARLKKFKPNMLTSSNTTRQSENFEKNLPVITIAKQLELYGEPLTPSKVEPTHITIGYLHNEMWTDIEAVYATSTHGYQSLRWVYKISDDPADGQAIIIEMPIEPIPDQPSRVRVKKKITN